MTSGEAELLRQALLAAVAERLADLHATAADEYGQRYVPDFDMTTTVGTATVRSAWIVLTGEDVLRLVTCHVR